MLKKKTLIICIFIILIVLLMIVLYFFKSNKPNNSNALENMENVSYIELSYGRKNKILNNQLSDLINNIYNNSTDQLKLYISDNGEKVTGQQPYVFVFYSRNDEVLYRFQFYDGIDEMILIIEKDSGNGKPMKVELYSIKNENVLEYVKSEVEEFNNELYNEDV